MTIGECTYISHLHQMESYRLKRNKIYFGITPSDFTITRDPE